ncbi:MAG: hypothetical protein NXI10_13205 [bacterium]|nr:hypothetical protein [bacterium]
MIKNYIIAASVVTLLVSCGNYNSRSQKDTPSDGSNNKEFIWDFDQEKIFIYSYTQTVVANNLLSKNGSGSRAEMKAVGNVNVRVKSDKLADVSLTKMDVTMISFNDDGSPSDTTTDRMPNNVVQDMTPNGRFDSPSVDFLFKVLFPLPNRDLKVGETDSIPMKVPFNANGSMLYSKGYNTLTFTGFETIQNRKCAVLEGVIDVSKMDIPEELNGSYKNATTGRATYYFDLKDRCFVGADIYLVMEMFMDSNTDEDEETGMFAKMKSDNTFKIRLEKIK